jgi:FixJ family two-component response regulator
LSAKTVEVHRANIKEEMKSAADLIRFAACWAESQGTSL